MTSEKKSKNYDALILECDQLIKTGQLSTVASLISKLNLHHLPRSARQNLAKICRRVGLVSQGLRILQSTVRQEKLNINKATPGEIAEYAVLLSRNGSIQEALNLLADVNPTFIPEASLYRAYCHISNWEYDQASVHLKIFLASNADEYAKLVARVNLISAFLALSDLDAAGELLEETISLAKKTGASRLVGNCLELRGRLHLYRHDFIHCRDDLDQALHIFSSSQSYDRFFIKKWQTILTAIQSRSVEPLIQFRGEAVSAGQWESVREADLFTAKVRFDQKLLDYLTFGTPMESYRQRIQSELGGRASPSFILGGNANTVLDLQDGQLIQLHDGTSSAHEHLSPGKKIHQVIAALVRDFYVPRNMGHLFSDLYPDEYFDINSSPLKIRQLLARTRGWMKENSVPIAIDYRKGTYSLSIQGSFGIKMALQSPSITPYSAQWDHFLKTLGQNTTFTSMVACQKLNWPRSTFLLFAEQAIQKGDLHRGGAGNRVFYVIREKSQIEAARSVA